MSNRYSPIIADVDGDGTLEAVCSTSSVIACLNVTGAPFNANAYPWPSLCFKGDIRHTGCYTDSDRDGLTDNYEITVGTDPLDSDTDSDGMTDYQEFLISKNPFVDESLATIVTTTSTMVPITALAGVTIATVVITVIIKKRRSKAVCIELQ